MSDKMIAAVKGDRRLEALAHERYAAYHIRGEWFRRVESLDEMLTNVEHAKRLAISNIVRPAIQRAEEQAK